MDSLGVGVTVVFFKFLGVEDRGISSSDEMSDVSLVVVVVVEVLAELELELHELLDELDRLNAFLFRFLGDGDSMVMSLEMSMTWIL